MITYTLKRGNEAERNLLTYFNVKVERSTGLIGRSSFKSGDTYNWKYLNGVVPDVVNRKYNNKGIVLSCWIPAESKQQLINRYNSLLNYLKYDGYIFLKATWPTDASSEVVPNPHACKGLFGLVYLDKVDNVQMKWRYGKNIIRFNLHFVDPYPMKRILKITNTTRGFDYDIDSPTELDIVTEDGTFINDILVQEGHVDCVNNSYILVCGDVVNASISITPTDSLQGSINTIYNEI